MSLTMTIEIPALDRLCDWLEGGNRAALMEEIKTEIVARLKEAAGNGTLEKAAKMPEPGTAKSEPAPESRRAPQEPPKPQPTEKPTAPVEATPDAKPVTLDAVQRAAAQMRDDGKLKAVTDMFPEFGIKKLSDLKGDALQQFGDRLRAMGAKI